MKTGKWKALSYKHGRCQSHTAENLVEGLKRTAVGEWGFEGKIIAYVHDNASNILLANTQLLEWDSSSCFAHTLQLAIIDGFKVDAVSRVVAAASRVVSHFHHSTVASQALRSKQEQQNLPQHCLIQHCRTRWNSICDVVERLHEQRWAIATVLSDKRFTKLSDSRTLEPTDQSWHIMEELIPVLKSLKMATTALCGESDMSISQVYPVTTTLL